MNETDNIARGNHVVPTEWAQQLKRERDEAREVLSSISLYLSVGMGEETTTAQQYEQRILNGIKMLTEPIAKLWKQAEKERDEAREVLERIANLSMNARRVEADYAEWEKAVFAILDLCEERKEK